MLDKFTRLDELIERKKLHCVECKRLTIHALEARCVGEWYDDETQENGGTKHSIFRCGACDAVCYETRTWDTYGLDYDVHGEPQVFESSVQYPAPVSAHFTFNTESTPDRLNALLNEMLYALAGSKMTLATVGLRLAVEFIVNDKECAGRTLTQKINDLHSQLLIDDDQRDLLHRIRKRGNAGAHEALAMNTRELVAGMSIIEGLLEKLYNGPARHEATMKKAKLLLQAEAPEEHMF